MLADHDFIELNRNKADFSAIYVQSDPRAYFRTLGALGYVIPHLARPVFDQLIEARQRAKGGPITVLDLGCSYGVNAALMKYSVTYDQLAERYDALSLMPLGSDDIRNLDRNYFAAWPRRRDIRVIGLDVSREAVSYAEACDVLDAGIVADLEQEEIPDWAAAELAKVDLIVSTGCVGYITNRSFEKLAVCTANGEAPWVASFVLRMFDYADIARTLKRQGLRTEKFEGATFVQRRFRDEEEMRGTLDALNARGISATAKEADGLFHAELFCSRPEAETRAHPLNRMLSIASGANRNYGRRPRLPSRPAKATATPARPVAAAL